MTTIILLTISNVFMTFAWYGHLKHKAAPLMLTIIVTTIARALIPTQNNALCF